jgi:hypothetical protein
VKHVRSPVLCLYFLSAHVVTSPLPDSEAENGFGTVGGRCRHDGNDETVAGVCPVGAQPLSPVERDIVWELQSVQVDDAAEKVVVEESTHTDVYKGRFISNLRQSDK